MSNTPDELRYTKEHEWVQELGKNRLRIGITDFAQSALGDVVYIALPKLNDELKKDQVCGEVESTKSVSEIYSPMTGRVLQVNESLDQRPELINGDPYGEGWIFDMEITEPQEMESLLSATLYRELLS
jgi:glycine cleavage system H protein